MRQPIVRKTAAGIVGALVAAGLVVAQWPDAARAMVLGLGPGCLIAAIALAIVLTYKGSGVLNFASGAMAMYSAYAYVALRRSGEIFLPPLPSSISFGRPLEFWPALAVTLLLAALLGLVCHLLVFRPLRQAPPLMKVVASVGVLITLQALVVLRFESAPLAIEPIFAKHPVKLPGNLVIPSDQLVLATIVLAVAVSLWALFRFTRFGLATRAAAETERGAVVLGYSPDWLAGVNWVLSTVVVGLLGVLVATVNGSITPTNITLLVVPALGAALVGGFTSFGITTLAAIAIAMVQELVVYLATLSWFPHTSQGPIPGVGSAVPLVVIIAVLLLRGRSLPTRGTLPTERFPPAPEPSRVAVKAIVLGIACVACMLFLSPEWRLGLINSMVGIVICLSLVVVVGFGGQISLAQMAIAGISGFALAKLATNLGVPFPLAPLLGASAGAAVGMAISVSAVRIRGVQLAVVTFACAVTIESLILSNPAWSGGSGGAAVPEPSFLGLRFGPNESASVLGSIGDGKLPNPLFGIFCLLAVLGVVAAVVNLRRSALGRRMLAVRSNERAAAAAGIGVTTTKLVAFGVSAYIAGLAGALSGYRFGSVSPEFFGGLASLTFLAFAFLGGITSVSGAVVGGMLVAGGVSFTALHLLFGVREEYALLIGGLGLTLTAVMNPEGVIGATRRSFDQIPTRLRRASEPGDGDAIRA